MRKTWLRILAVGLALAMAASFTACSNAPSGTPGGETSGGEVDALLWLSSYPEVVDQFVEAWKTANPDITLNVQMMSGNTTNENLEPRVAANNMPDVCSVDATEWFYTNADNGYFADVSNTQAWQYQLDSLKSQYTTPNGKAFGVAYGMATMFMFYNEDLFTQAGVTALPQTYEEFVALCEQLKAAGITPMACPGGFANMLGHTFISAGIANLVNDSDLFTKTTTTNYDYSAEGWEETFDRLLEFRDAGYFNAGYMSTDNAETIRLFSEGEVAMCWNGSWSAGDFLTLGDHVKVMVVPWNAEGGEVRGNVAAETGFGMGVNNKNNTANAAKFFDFIAYENYANFQNATGTIPTFSAEDCPGTVVDERSLAAVEQINALSCDKLEFQLVPAAVQSALEQFAQDVLTGTRQPSEISAVLNPIQSEFYTNLQ